MTFQAETERRVAEQAPAACLLLVAMAGLSGICEVLSYPDRRPYIAALEIFVVLGAASVYAAARWRPAWCIPILLIAVNFLGVASPVYHAKVGASAEACLLILTALLCSATVMCHWGWRMQLLASLGAAVAFPIALLTHLKSGLPAATLLLFFACVVALTAYGAGLIQRYLRRAFDLTEEVRARELRLQSYLDQALIGIGILSPEGRWRDVNSELCRMLGFTRDELLASPWRSLVPAGDRRGIELDGLLTGAREAACGDRQLMSASGRLVDALVSARAVRSSGGRVQDVVVMVQDITERKRFETELAVAKEGAERAYRSKSEFLASMSHDFRTPINIIFGMTDMALEADESGEQREYLTVARRAAFDLLALVDEVLELSRIEAGRIELRRRVFPVREWLAETVAPLQVLANAKGLDLAWQTAPGVPEIANGDPNRLRQVVVNLVTNALKYTDAGRVTVHVETRGDGADEAALHFTISDTGVGISMDEQQRIFEAYVQGETSREGPGSGAGLGLAICSRLVDLMGGRIWVDSALGEGSRFHFTAALGPSE